MTTLVAIVIHNRFSNLKTWIKCWQQCEQDHAQLVIIHNYYENTELCQKFHDYCKQHNIHYVPRTGPGFDIGAFQDVCRNRLLIPDYDYLIWACDDTLPVSKKFVQQFTEAMTPGVGVAAMQISNSVAPHVRTTGFCIRREVAERLQFPADPVTTKQHCYYFEHRGGQHTMTNQIRAMGLSAVMVSPVSTAPLWDSLHPNISKRLDRQQEFNQVWGIAPPGDKVAFIVPIFDAFPEIISALMCQTYRNWELLLIDDNPAPNYCKPLIDVINDNRIKYIKRERMGKYGHPHRQWALDNLDQLSDAEFVCISNGDNYYVPGFLFYMMQGFKENPLAKAVFCESMTHNYIKWGILQCSLKVGFLDCGGVIVRREVATEIGWRDVESHSSDFTYFSDIISRYSAKSFHKVKGNLFCHN